MDLTNLLSLDLSGNGINLIEPKTFAFLPELKQLTLVDNRISSLGSRMFGTLVNL